MEVKSFYAQDTYGNALLGATCTVYFASTVSPAPIFDDVGGAKSNPFLSDATSGLVQFGAADGFYDISIIADGYSSTLSAVQFSSLDGKVYHRPTKSAADTLAASLPDGATVIVDRDETLGGVSVRYSVASATLTSPVILNLNVVSNIGALKSNSADGTLVNVRSYHAGLNRGGGTFYWDSTGNKNLHNGGTVIDPTRTFPSDWTNQTQVAAWFTASTGAGVWRRQFEGDILVSWFGTKGDGIANDQPSSQNAVNFGATREYGSVVLFDDGSFLMNEPLVLPRTGTTPRYFVQLKGSSERGTRLIGNSSTFTAGRAVVEWADVNARAWLQSIKRMTIVPADVDGCRAIHYKNSVPYTDLTSMYAERLQIDFDELLIEGSNEFNPGLIKLEGNLIACDWGTVTFDPKIGSTFNYDSIGFDLDTEDFGAVSNDAGGLGYSTIKLITATARRGGFVQLIKGRLNRVTIENILGGNGTKLAPFIELTNSFQGRVGSVFNEGKGGQPQYKFTNCLAMKWECVQLGAPSDQGLGIGNGMELYGCKNMQFDNISRSIGAVSFASFGKHQVVCDVNTKGCTFKNTIMSGVTSSTFGDEISDGGDRNSFECIIPSANNNQIYYKGYQGRTLSIGPWYAENLPATNANIRMSRGYPSTAGSLVYDRYAMLSDGYVTGVAVTFSAAPTSGTITVSVLKDGVQMAGTFVEISNADAGNTKVLNIPIGERKAGKGTGIQVLLATSGLAPITIDLVVDVTIVY